MALHRAFIFGKGLTRVLGYRRSVLVQKLLLLHSSVARWCLLWSTLICFGVIQHRLMRSASKQNSRSSNGVAIVKQLAVGPHLRLVTFVLTSVFNGMEGSSPSTWDNNAHFGAKSIGFWSSVVLLLNNVIGPELVPLPFLFQQVSSIFTSQTSSF